tara:strand:+ start:1370 stop:1603 length:234 start_codon:yes stop_codon:yes gene_type:complete
MKEIEQIKMRKDIEVLKHKYKIPILSLAKKMGLSECNLRFFLGGRKLVDRNHEKVKQGLLDVMKDLKKAKEYKGFDE